MSDVAPATATPAPTPAADVAPTTPDAANTTPAAPADPSIRQLARLSRENREHLAKIKELEGRPVDPEVERLTRAKALLETDQVQALSLFFGTDNEDQLNEKLLSLAEVLAQREVDPALKAMRDEVKALKDAKAKEESEKQDNHVKAKRDEVRKWHDAQLETMVADFPRVSKPENRDEAFAVSMELLVTALERDGLGDATLTPAQETQYLREAFAATEEAFATQALRYSVTTNLTSSGDSTVTPTSNGHQTSATGSLSRPDIKTLSEKKTMSREDAAELMRALARGN